MAKTLKIRKAPSESAAKFSLGTKKREMMVMFGK